MQHVSLNVNLADGAIPAVSIIMPCRNELHEIRACIDSILSQQSPFGGFELIVADGMSTDGTREILTKVGSEDARVRVIDNPGKIVSTGLNSSIAVARGDIIIRMDGHTDYAPDYLRQCVAVLQETHADNVGGPWIARGAGYVSRAIAAAFQSRFAV